MLIQLILQGKDYAMNLFDHEQLIKFFIVSTDIQLVLLKKEILKSQEAWLFIQQNVCSFGQMLEADKRLFGLKWMEVTV